MYSKYIPIAPIKVLVNRSYAPIYLVIKSKDYGFRRKGKNALSLFSKVKISYICGKAVTAKQPTILYLSRYMCIIFYQSRCDIIENCTAECILA